MAGGLHGSSADTNFSLPKGSQPDLPPQFPYDTRPDLTIVYVQVTPISIITLLRLQSHAFTPRQKLAAISAL